jgi:hypothetical protein
MLELRAFYLLGGSSTTRATPPACFTLVIFEIGYSSYAMAGLDYNLPIYTSQIAWVMGEYHYTHSLIDMGSHNVFACAGLKPIPS